MTVHSENTVNSGEGGGEDRKQRVTRQTQILFTFGVKTATTTLVVCHSAVVQLAVSVKTRSLLFVSSLLIACRVVYQFRVYDDDAPNASEVGEAFRGR